MDRYLHVFEHAKEEFLNSMNTVFHVLPDLCISLIGQYASSFSTEPSEIFYNSLKETAAYHGNIEAYISIRNKISPSSMYYDINYINSKGQTLLYIAASRGHTKFVRYLLEHGAIDSSDISIHKDMSFTFPLMSAVAKGHYDTVVALVNSPEIIIDRHIYIYDGEEIDGGNALNWAIHFGHYRIAKYLLSKGLDPNSKTQYGNIFTDAAAVNQPRTLKLLYTNPFILKELIHECDYEGVTPLIRACYHGHTEMVTCLLDYGVDPNDKPGKAPSPLEWACRHGFISIIKKLISHGAICSINTVKVCIRYEQQESLQYILESIDHLTSENDSALVSYAMIKNNYKAVRMLIRYGYAENFTTKGELKYVDVFGRNKLMSAVNNGCTSAECISEFLKPKYKININETEKTVTKRNIAMICLTEHFKNNDGHLHDQLKVILDAGINTSQTFIYKRGKQHGSLTILDFAILYCKDSIVKLILPYMKDINRHCTITGETSLLRAVSEHRSSEIIDSLLEHGANIYSSNLLDQNALVKSILSKSDYLIKNYMIGYFLRKGCDPNIEFRPYEDGPITTPLMYALEHNSIINNSILFNSLFQETTDKYKIFDKGYTLLMSAMFNKNLHIIANLDDEEEKEYIHRCTDDKNNALHYAIKGNYFGGVIYCIENLGIDPFLKNADNKNAMGLSISLGHDEITEYLVKKMYY